MTGAEQFFYDHAGYSVNPGESTEQGKLRSAEDLALAETWAAHNRFEVRWEDDWELYHPREYGYEPSTCEWAALVTPAGEVLASLGCIDDATPEYRRVVAAELAYEAWWDAAQLNVTT